ncbi:MAG: hypothetical protein A3G81_13620 [Betaproteobacteria bacterium RIFCSPLOWO2_12_FULL_65_14]|nr:MAG: hypothetical protein A3G81_13620 [Betaproteobacteria bacterium RIFCSPLOWO2_12_FULL_65_14]
MRQARLAFTAVFLNTNHGYVGFIEELPGINAHARTIEETRRMLRNLAMVVFDEERRSSDELLAGKIALRETFDIPLLNETCAEAPRDRTLKP